MSNSSLPIEQIYPERSKTYFDTIGDYEPMVKSFGTILVEVRDDDYQGASRYLLQNASRFGVLVISWGSCSACDALQACESYTELDNLRHKIANSVRWFTSPNDCLVYLNSKDWEVESSYRAVETKKFLTKSKRVLQQVQQ